MDKLERNWMVGLAVKESSYNGNSLKNAANKKINLNKCFLAKPLSYASLISG